MPNCPTVPCDRGRSVEAGVVEAKKLPELVFPSRATTLGWAEVVGRIKSGEVAIADRHHLVGVGRSGVGDPQLNPLPDR